MTVDHLVEHLTEPSTIRGLIWTLGAIVALTMIARNEPKGALEVLTQTALAVGAVGVLTRERKPPCDCPETSPQPPPVDFDDGK
jgi:hypothetical protein